MAKESTVISGAELVAALERVFKVMKVAVKRDPELTYVLAEGGLSAAPSLAVIFRFNRETMRHEMTTICSEKRAAKAWNKANAIKI